MLSIFQKKYFLVDLLEGFTDFHNHLLPGIDDGANSAEDSIAMIKKFNEFGVTNIVASPHVMGEFYPNTPDTILPALDKVKKNLPHGNSIKAAGEYMMDQYLIDQLEKDNVLNVTENYVLVEMSYFQAPINLAEILFKIQNTNLKPILAHPERYTFYHDSGLDKYKDLKTRGCDFQLNMLSLTPHYGTGIQKKAFQLLENGMIDFISSDAHRMEHLEKIGNIKLKKKQLNLLEPIIEKSKALFR
ncbi:tyrosine-protein phosphatase [Salegentibacter mishustinae]|uniref:protein-tyrosine-phosphatase n=1 Tax=Salegentibacter mishustinae TaxID=270918 RepID=A0A0Q9Z8A8_9FLAO|nr:CpsB/CapC family capsule biosynthesis tyrosine phosphatase [Salegentibacter mishustinae]KRG29190.1 histidinol phosphatase [Salegentibacter mishustinae]PNW21759.1 histidinol phosphatase [Salegentibacter mishustinae]PZX65101.1 protein-tyrosine phosphatase [Salegentibacter mishustinae]GGW87327.1 capsular polysaccharide biosynthesis protein [Salegentibacter mishustinae]